MGQPWGLSGTEFIGVYAAAIAVSVLIPQAVRIMVGSSGGGPSRELHPYETGYLAAGGSRVAQVVIADLVGSGVLRVDSTGKLYQVLAVPPGSAAASFLPPYGLPAGLRTAAACRVVMYSQSMERIRWTLRASGLLVSAAGATAFRLVRVGLATAVLVTGLLGIAEGVANDRQVGSLVVLFVVSMFVANSQLIRISAPVRTSAGRSQLGELQRRCPKGARQQVPVSGVLAAGGGFPGAVVMPGIFGLAGLTGIALWGFSEVADKAVRAALLAGMPKPVESAGGGGGGCGGGGCGGGGCGG